LPSGVMTKIVLMIHALKTQIWLRKKNRIRELVEYANIQVEYVQANDERGMLVARSASMWEWGRSLMAVQQILD